MPMTSYEQVEQAVAELIRRPSTSLVLERTTALLGALGDPQKAYGGALVAGTNGKGSTCAMLRAVLTACGKRVGGNPSPHLTDIRDRFVIGLEPISATLLMEAADRTARALKTTGLECSEFEIGSAMAFEAFRLADCDAVVAEVGLGGRWDPTNVYRPGTKVITSIDFDHTDLLGPDLASIAGEKSGIIHEGDTAVVPALADDASRVISERAATVSARIRRVADYVRVSVGHADWSGQEMEVTDQALGRFRLRLPLLGPHQAANLATALCALGPVADDLGIELTPEAVVTGIGNLSHPGRLEVLEWRDSETPGLVIDVAHNVEAMQATVRVIQSLHRGPVIVIFGCYENKDVAGILDAVPAQWRCVITKAPHARGLPAAAVAAVARQRGLPVEYVSDDISECLMIARKMSEEAGLILALGSFAVAGCVRQMAGNGENQAGALPYPPGECVEEEKHGYDPEFDNSKRQCALDAPG